MSAFNVFFVLLWFKVLVILKSYNFLREIRFFSFRVIEYFRDFLVLRLITVLRVIDLKKECQGF